MKFLIDSRIFERFPSTVIGVVIARDIRNDASSADVIQLFDNAQASVKKTHTVESYVLHPRIEAWRKVYETFGVKPKEARSSIENLYRLILSGVKLRSAGSLVDLYNVVSLTQMLPVGGEDLDKMQGDLQLTIAGPSEAPAMMLGDKEARPPHEGEVIYKDDMGTICRRWNWREADRTKLTRDTKNAILVLEGIAPVSRGEVEKATNELRELVLRHCGGTATITILDARDSQLVVQ